MKRMQKRIVITNGVAAAGHMLLVAAWALLLAVIAMFLLASPLMPADNVAVPTAQSSFLPVAADVAAGYVAVAVFGLLTLAVVALLPYLIGKWSSRFLKRVVATLRIPPSNRHLFYVKSCAAVFPLCGFALVYGLLIPEDTVLVAVYAADFCMAAGAVLFFAVQLLLVRHFKLPYDKIW